MGEFAQRVPSVLTFVVLNEQFLQFACQCTLHKNVQYILLGGGGASRSQSALHMHVLVCICSNVRQFQEIIVMIQLCYHTNHCSCWPCYVNTEAFLCYKTEKGTLTSPSFIHVTLRVLALLGQVTWTETVAIRPQAGQQSAPHMHVLVCICSNVRQFH